MSTPKSLFIIALCFAGFPTSSSAQQASIVGTWHGTSLCVDLKSFPNCKNEEVIYVVEPVAHRQDSVLLKASKIVAGKIDPMGDLGFTRKPGTNVWTSEFKSRYHSLWSLTVSDSTISGTLVDLPADRLVRRVEVRREH